MTSAIGQARKIFKRRGGTLRTREALAEGIHPRTVYAMRDVSRRESSAAIPGSMRMAKRRMKDVSRSVHQGSMVRFALDLAAGEMDAARAIGLSTVVAV